MTRLGANYTVTGYLDEVARKSFLIVTTRGPENLRGFLAKLPECWNVEDFVSLFESELVPLGWGYKINRQKSALGRLAKIQIFLPTVSRIFHSGDDAHPAWTEKTLSAHAWSILVRKGKAKLDVIPTSLYISEHALRRIYERSGGCAYSEFPNLAKSLLQEALDKIDILLREFVFVEGEPGVYATALPTSGGLAVINWSLLHASQAAADFGILLSIKGKRFSRGRGSFRPAEFWNLPKLDAFGHEVDRLPTAIMRTFYSDEEISDARRETCVLLEVMLNNVEPSSVSPQKLIDAAKDPSGRRIVPGLKGAIPQASSGLRADIRASMNWLNARNQGTLHFVPYGKGLDPADAFNRVDWDALGALSEDAIARTLNGL